MTTNNENERLYSICPKCNDKACQKGKNTFPNWCMQYEGSWLSEALDEYNKTENKKLYKTAAHIESTGYKKWPRLVEIAEYALAANFKNIGLAYCIGLEKEAKKVVEFFEKKDLKVNSAVCCCGGIDKSKIGVPPEDRFSEEGFEAGCNPIGQAKLLAECGTDINVVLGLCVGHDSLFFKYSVAPTTVLAVKDRVLGHNSLAAIYNSESYYRHLFEGE